MAYIKDIKNTIIKIARAVLIDIQFNSSSISFMGFIIIQTFIRYIKFYIVKINTSFLFCFVDLD